MFNVKELTFVAQLPLPVAVNVKVIKPVSANVGVYVGFSALALEKLPAPPLQIKVAKLLADAGVARVAKSNGEPWQIAAFEPALTFTAGVIVSCMVLVCVAQLPLPVAVKVKVTTPVSPTPGV